MWLHATDTASRSDTEVAEWGAALTSPTRVAPPRRRRPALRVSRRPAARRAVAAVADEVRWELLPLAGVADHLGHLPAGARVTVTCSPKLGVDATVDLAVRLTARGFAATPHLAARQIAGHDHLAALLHQLAAVGVDDIFVVGGDATEPAGPFADGLALLAAIADSGHRFAHIGIPAYPEGHHRIDDATLWAALDAKHAHATYLVTQMCFESGAICRWIAAARARDITLPVYAGIPGVVDPATLLRVSARIGIGDSIRFLRGNRHTAARLLRPGGYRPDALLRGLGARVRAGHCDVAGLHVYTFNRIQPTVDHLQELRRRAFETAGPR